jgi:hypothetical protein
MQNNYLHISFGILLRCLVFNAGAHQGAGQKNILSDK